MNKPHQHTIQFSTTERSRIKATIRRGKHHARVITRARILVLTGEGDGKDAIAIRLGIGRSTVQSTRDHDRAGGLERALYDAPRPGQPANLDEQAAAHLVAMPCAEPPDGSDHWTLALLQERMIQDGNVPDLATVALWKPLNQRGIKPWRATNGVHAARDA